MKSKMESKMKIKPIVGTERLFKILNKRFQNGVSTKNKSGKSFSLKEDLQATKNLYQNMNLILIYVLINLLLLMKHIV